MERYQGRATFAPAIQPLPRSRERESRVFLWPEIENRYYCWVRAIRFLAITLYVGYLVNAGLLLILLPWSSAWGMLLTLVPPETAVFFDQPWLRGVLSAFGFLHLLLVAWELINPSLLTPVSATGTQSQNVGQS